MLCRLGKGLSTMSPSYAGDSRQGTIAEAVLLHQAILFYSVLHVVSCHLWWPGDAWSNRQMCSCASTIVTVSVNRQRDGDGRRDPAEELHLELVGVEPRLVAREAVKLWDERRQRRELVEVAGEGVEVADGGVRVPCRR